jgi:hypothetical protein
VLSVSALDRVLEVPVLGLDDVVGSPGAELQVARPAELSACHGLHRGRSFLSSGSRALPRVHMLVTNLGDRV